MLAEADRSTSSIATATATAIACAAMAVLVSWHDAPSVERVRMPPAPSPSVETSVRHPRAVLETSLGDISCVLDDEHAPRTVANFIELARSARPFYDGLTFHRVIPGFVIQGGDPVGDGTGGLGYQLPDEISPTLHFDGAGVLAMANRGRDTNGSQFFITDAAATHLDGHSTIFGRCENLDVIHAIASVPRAANDRPIDPVTIEHVIIVGDPATSRLPSRFECHPVVSGCGCAYECARGVRSSSEGRGMAAWQITDDSRDSRTDEAVLTRWCFDHAGHAQRPGPGTHCLDVFLDRTACGGECIPTTEYLGCHAVGDGCKP